MGWCASRVSSIDLLLARRGPPPPPSEPQYLADLFAEQRAFFDDPAKKKGAVSGRRAGKTWVCAAGLFDAANKHPRSLAPYIALSGVSARRIMWPILAEFNDRYGLGMRPNRNQLTMDLANGSQIFLVGGDDNRKVEALRGGKYSRVVIDEAGSFPRDLLQYLSEDVLDPALMDLDGDFWIVGSPNASCSGYFHDLTTGLNAEVAKVPTHHWNALQNVNITNRHQWLEKLRTDRNWTIQHPKYRREYLGLWVRDDSSLVFRFNPKIHLVAEPPLGTLSSVIGVDLGTSQSKPTTAFVVVGWARHDRTSYVLHAEKHAGMTPSSSAEIVVRLKKKFNASHIVADEGGIGKGWTDEWRNRYGLAVMAAEKRSKAAYVDFLNDDFDRKRLFLVEQAASDLRQEIEILQWDEDRKNFDKEFADHASDAFLYAWRECNSWNERVKATDPLDEDPILRVRREQSQMKAEAMRIATRRDRRRVRGGQFW